MTTIRVGTGPEPFAFAGRWLDGHSAAVTETSLGFDEQRQTLVISVAGRPPVHWAIDDIRTLRDQAQRDDMILSVNGDPVARLIVEDPAAQDILRSRCDRLNRGPAPGGLRRLWFWAGAALASVAAIILVLVPVMANQLAAFLPPEGEAALGKATLGQIRQALADTESAPVAFCDSAAGSKALFTMAVRLTDGLDLPYDLSIHVLNHDMVNAFALPGGHVVLFRGLIDNADGPDEVAGVLAHEIGHVVSRDPTAAALRTAGSFGVLSLLLGDFAGGLVVLFLANQLIQADYSRAAEAAADQFAIDRLLAANVSPEALARFMDKLKAEFGDDSAIGRHFASHPQLGDRAETARGAIPVLNDFRPILTPAQWRTVRRMCG